MNNTEGEFCILITESYKNVGTHRKKEYLLREGGKPYTFDNFEDGVNIIAEIETNPRKSVSYLDIKARIKRVDKCTFYL